MSERDEGTTPAETPPDDAPGQQPPAPPQWPAPPEPPYGAPPGYGAPPPGQPPGYGPPPGQWPPGYGGPPGQWPPGYPPPLPPAPAPIHPLTVGRALSVGWSLYRFRWKALIGLFAVLTIPAYALQILWALAYAPVLAEWQQALSLRQLGLPGPPVPALPIDALVGLIVVSLVAGAAAVLGAAAALSILGWTYGGGWRTWRQALGAAFGRLPALIGLMVLYTLAFSGIIAVSALLAIAVVGALGDGLGVFLALVVAVAAFVAVVFVGLRWSFAVHAIMLEGRGALEGLGRSWRLVSGSTWRVLGYLLLLILIVSLLGLLVSIVQLVLFGFDVDPFTRQPVAFSAVRVAGQLALQAGFTIVITPWFLAVMLLLYYDLRLRSGETLTPPPA